MARKTIKKTQAPQVESTQSKDYELILILRPDMADEAIETVVKGINQFITTRNGAVAEFGRWGKRKLGYPIKHALEGHYLLARFQMGPEHSKELKAYLQISEDILRHLLIRLDS